MIADAHDALNPRTKLSQASRLQQEARLRALSYDELLARYKRARAERDKADQASHINWRLKRSLTTWTSEICASCSPLTTERA